MVAAEDAAEPADSAPVRAATPAVTAAVFAASPVVVAAVCAATPASQSATVFTLARMKPWMICKRIFRAASRSLKCPVIMPVIEEDTVEPICSKLRL